MIKQHFSDRLASLNIYQKTTLLSALLVLVSLFLPWYESVTVNRGVVLINGFSGIAAVGGYLLSLFALTIIFISFTPVFLKRSVKKHVSWRSSTLILFFSLQSLFLAALYFPLLMQYFLADSLTGAIRFGIYVTLITTFIMSISAWMDHKQSRNGHYSNINSQSTPSHALFENQYDSQPARNTSQYYQNTQRASYGSEDKSYDGMTPSYQKKSEKNDYNSPPSRTISSEDNNLWGR